MRFNFKALVAVGIAIGIAEAWWNYDTAKELSPDAPPAPATAASPVLKARARETQPRPAATATVTPAVATWQSKVSQVLTSATPPGDQARSLLALFPNLPPAGQFEAAHHISNLLPNESYATWSGYLTNSAISTEVRNVIYADLLQRPEAVKLPLLLELARNPASGHATEALALLRQILREDCGADWQCWQSSILARQNAPPN